METTSSLSSSSYPRSPPHQTRVVGDATRRRTRSTDIVINEPDASSSLVKPKTEPLLLPVKQEHLAMAENDETILKWAWYDYVREETERQRRSLEEIAAHRCGREEGGIIILDDIDEEAPGPSNPVRHGDLGQWCSKDDVRRQRQKCSLV
ncbi:Cysteine-rich receptor-like protein kinase 10 [Hordeum vulgare]|nr:Cysteine-rich receptor-like protein kinase 10 [Hordeum vulgare]